jgi:outer membrane biosynthesis protein TonB
MRKLLFALSALAAGCTLASTAPAVAAARHYDCSKPGNANKAECKNAKPAKAPPARKAKETKVTVSKTQKTKAAEAPKPARAAKPAPRPTATPRAAPAPKAAPSSENQIAAGATAQCKDGTYSHAKNHRGACSRHGGVAKWMA